MSFRREDRRCPRKMCRGRHRGLTRGSRKSGSRPISSADRFLPEIAAGPTKSACVLDRDATRQKSGQSNRRKELEPAVSCRFVTGCRSTILHVQAPPNVPRREYPRRNLPLSPALAPALSPQPEKRGPPMFVGRVEALVADPKHSTRKMIQASRSHRLLPQVEWTSLKSTLPRPNSNGGAEQLRGASKRLPPCRGGFLLMAMEEFTPVESHRFSASRRPRSARLIEPGGARDREQVRDHLLIIEDEPRIAMDIESLSSRRIRWTASPHP